MAYGRPFKEAHGRGEPLERPTQESQGRRRAENIQRERPQPAVGNPLFEGRSGEPEHRLPRTVAVESVRHGQAKRGNASREASATAVWSSSAGYEPRERAWLKVTPGRPSREQGAEAHGKREGAT